MDFVKKNLLIVISTAAAVLALAILGLGIFQVGSTQELLGKAQQLMENVNTVLKGVPVTTPDNLTINLIPTEKAVSEVKDLELKYRDQGYQVLQGALEENIGYDPKTKTSRRQLILDGVFPKSVTEDLPFKFPYQYKEAIARLVAKMKAGVIPGEKEILAERERTAQEYRLASANARGGTRGSTGRGRTAVIREDQIEMEAYLRAADQRASQIKVYCDPLKALDIIPDLYSRNSGIPPLPEDMWWAQLSYWLQDDIASAVAAANASAKDVRESVVKQIQKIRMMHGYIVASETSNRMEFVGFDELQGAPDSFTGLGSGKYFDVLRFQIDMVIDARRIPEFVNAMYLQSHYLLYMWKVEAMATVQTGTAGFDKNQSLLRFGPNPVVRLTTWWEAYMIRDFYHWGIVGYGYNRNTGKTYVTLYNGKQQSLDNPDSRTELEGLMPRRIRQALGSEPEDNKPAIGGGSGGPPEPRRNSRSRRSGGGRDTGSGE
jgi:hypothetical protein